MESNRTVYLAGVKPCLTSTSTSGSLSLSLPLFSTRETNEREPGIKVSL